MVLATDQRVGFLICSCQSEAHGPHCLAAYETGVSKSFLSEFLPSTYRPGGPAKSSTRSRQAHCVLERASRIDILELQVRYHPSIATLSCLLGLDSSTGRCSEAKGGASGYKMRYRAVYV